MNPSTDLVDRYIAAWNETDPERRGALIAETWTEDARYLDPVMQGEGHAGIDAMIEGAQARFRSLRFTRDGGVDTHNGRMRFAWALGPEGGAPIARGTDFAVVVGDRLASVTGFFDLVPDGAAGDAGDGR